MGKGFKLRGALLCSVLCLLTREAAAATTFRDHLVYDEEMRCCRIARRRLVGEGQKKNYRDKNRPLRPHNILAQKLVGDGYFKNTTGEETKDFSGIITGCNEARENPSKGYLCASHAEQNKEYKAKNPNKTEPADFKSNCTAERCNMSIRTFWLGKHDQCIAAAVVHKEKEKKAAFS